MTGSPKRSNGLWTMHPNPYMTFLSRFTAGRKPEIHHFQVQSDGCLLAPAGLTCKGDWAMVPRDTEVLGT